MLISKINSVALTGGATYDTITDSSVKLWRKIQVYNNTGADLKYKINSSTAYVTVPAGNIFEIESNEPLESCNDTVTMNGSGTISVEIQYYSGG